MLVSGPAGEELDIGVNGGEGYLRSVARVGKGVVAQACSISLLDLVAGKLFAQGQFKI